MSPELKAPEGFKKIQVGPQIEIIPVEWKKVRVDEVTENLDRQRDPIKSSEREHGDVPYYGATGQVDSVKEYIFDENLVLVGEDGANWAPFGGTSYIISGKSWVNNHVHVLRTTEIVDEYLQEYLDYVDMRYVITGSTRGKLNKGELNRFPILYPPIPEQRRIADILSTVDEQIQQTDEVIERTEEMRFGLMTEFFHTGYYDHPLTEEPTFGQVPADWDIRELAEVANVEMGSSPKSKYYNEEGDGLPFYQANNEFGYRNPTYDRWCSEPQKIAEKGDTLVTIRGTYVGQVNVANERCCIGRGLAAVSAHDVDEEYIYHHLAHRERYVKSIASGSTFDSINSRELETLSVLVPPRDEQKKIASCLRKIQEKYRREMEHKEKLQELKRGLMQDLLTGKVRVNTE